MAGELHIGGAGLARGYVAASPADNARFIPHPHRDGERLYRTGDTARWLEDGAIEFLGRRDGQIKIRGHRIEVGDVEAALKRAPGIRHCAVGVQPGGPRPALTAWIVADREIPTADLRRHLAGHLPDAMIPARFQVLPALPLTPSGKIDRKALAAMPLAAMPVTTMPPARQDGAPEVPESALEAGIAKIWEEVLGRSGIGRTLNFFEIGGDSVGVLRVLSRLEHRLGIDVPVDTFYRAPTIADLAAAGAATSIVTAHLQTAHPQTAAATETLAPCSALTPAQHRLWVIAEMDPDNGGYAMPAAFQLDGMLDVAALRRALAVLIERHEPLRTVFPMIEGEPRQKVLPPAPLTLDPELVADLDAARAAMVAEIARPFDLAHGPLLRCRLFRLSERRHLLLVCLHHIIGDGQSLAVMAGELGHAYDALTAGREPALTPLPLTYRAAASAIAARRQDPRAKADRAYWLDRFADPVPPLDLPTDFPRSAETGYDGGVHVVPVDADVAAGLREMAHRSGGTLLAVVLALVARLLQRVSGARDLVIGIPVAGRFNPDFEPLVGLFAETCPVRITGDPDEDFEALLTRVGATVRGAIGHDRFSFDQLVEDLDVQSQAGRSALYDVMVAGQVGEAVPLTLSGLTVDAVPLGPAGSQVDLTVNVLDHGGGLELSIVYRRRLFRAERIAAFADDLIALTRAVGSLDRGTASVESRLLALWREVLGRDGFGIDDTFLSVGGHSLKAARLVRRIWSEFGASVKLRDVFAHPTVRSLAALIEGTEPVPSTAEAPPETRSLGEAVAPASAAQTRLWVLAQMAPDPRVYAMVTALELTGPLNVAALDRAFQALVARHEALRTVFETDGDGVLRQRIQPSDACGFRLEVVDGAAEGPDVPDFNLATGPLFQVRLERRAADRHRLRIAQHHTIGDGWSWTVLARDLSVLYRAALDKSEPDLPALAMQYRHVEVQRSRWLDGPGGAAARRFWLETLSGDIPRVNLPADFPRPKLQSFDGALHAFTLPPRTAERLKAFAEDRGATLFMGLLAAVKALIHRYTGLEDVVVATPVAGRDEAALDDQVGLYMNTLALRTRFSAERGFAALLDALRDGAADAFDHQGYPFDRLVEDLDLPRDLSRNPVFDVLVALQNHAPAEVDLARVTARAEPDAGGIAKVDLSFYFTESETGIGAWVEYNTGLLRPERIRRLEGHFHTLLDSALADPEAALGQLDILTTEEAGAERRWTTAADIPGPTTVVDLFERQAAAKPNAVAVRCQGRHVTYRTLDRWADRIAARLRARADLAPGERVAVDLPRSEALIAAMFGIWKAGLVHVPIAPGDPAERKAFLIADAGCKAVIGGDADSIVPRIDPTNDRSRPTARGAECSPGDVAYVFYTSGSTGKPKGVMIEHRNLAAFARILHGAFGMRDGDAVFALTTATFDISMLELICPLTQGLRVTVADDATVADPALTLADIRDSGVTVLQVTPSRLALLLAQDGGLGAVRLLLVGGEALPAYLAASLRALHGPDGKPIAAFNVYGPTETTIWSTAEEIGDAPPGIGWALPGEVVLILSLAGRPQPVGVPGEIAIAGAGVGRGYLARADLTAERFTADPTQPERRMYRTGDLGLRRADGGIEFLGRVDDQVKLRGFRIEPGEIEAALTGHPSVHQAKVVVRDIAGAPELVAYVVAPTLDLPGPGEADLRARLHETLPPHMVPMVIVALDALPLLPSGKIDRNALPNPEVAPPASASAAALEGPADTLESGVLALWRTVLARPHAGPDDDFFDGGGHSLRAAQLANRVRETFGVAFGLRDVFLLPTARRMVREIARRRTRDLPPLAAVATDGDYPLSHAQRRLFALDRLDPGGCAYLIAGAFRIAGPLDRSALERAMAWLVARHEALRTSFRLIDGDPRQVVEAAPAFTLGYSDLSNAKDPEADAAAIVGTEARTPIRSDAAPLFRAHLLRVARDRHILAFTLHHLIADGWSLGVLLEDLEHAYEAFASDHAPTRPALALHYKDYAAWERVLATTAARERSRTYWHTRLAGPLPVLTLPMANDRPARRSDRGGQVPFAITSELGRALSEKGRKQGATLFMMLLAASASLFHRLTGARDMILGSVTGNRDHSDLETMVGCFVNPLPLRLAVSPDDTLSTVLEGVRTASLEALEHGIYPFDQLVRELGAGRDASRSPLFDIGLTWNALPHMERDRFAGLALSPFGDGAQAAKYDLLIVAGPDGDGIAGVIEYSTDLFQAGDIEVLARQITRILEQVADADPSIGALDLGTSPQGDAPAITPLSIDLNF